MTDHVAVIGGGGMGGYSFEQGMREQLVAICDVDDNTIAKAMKQFGEKQKDKPAPKVPRYEKGFGVRETHLTEEDIAV